MDTRQKLATAALAADAEADALTTLALRTEARAAFSVTAETHRLVTAARDAGRTWAEIGKALATTADAARWSWEGSWEDRGQRLAAARTRASARPSTRPADLPGVSVQEFAVDARVTVGAIYARIQRGTLDSVTVEDSGRKYVRVLAQPASRAESADPLI